MLIVTLVVLGGLMLLVVCSGMNERYDDAPKPGTDEASRSECQWQRVPPK